MDSFNVHIKTEDIYEDIAEELNQDSALQTMK